MQIAALKSQSQQKQELTTPPKQRLQTSLQTKYENNPKQASKQGQNLPSDLAEIVAVWPELPEHIKAAVNQEIYLRVSATSQVSTEEQSGCQAFSM